MTRLRRGGLVALVVIAVVGSACGGNESDPSTTVAAPQTTTTTTTPDTDNTTTTTTPDTDDTSNQADDTTTTTTPDTDDTSNQADDTDDTTTTTTPDTDDTSNQADDTTTTTTPDTDNTSNQADDTDDTTTTTTPDTDNTSNQADDTDDTTTTTTPDTDNTTTTTTPDTDDTDDTNNQADDTNNTTTTTTPDTDDTSNQADDTVGITVPPAELGFDPFYEKYLDLEGLPIISSARVPDEVLLQARRLISEMLTNRRDVLSTLAANSVRVAIMAESSGITELPELSDLYEAFPGVDWDNRTRGGGVGPTFERPVIAIAEENLLCYSTDLFPNEEILVHEAAHAVLQMGIESQPGGVAFRQELERAYRDALDAGLWQNTYAAENPDEYWAEGVQSWFGVNDPPGPIHNEINTRRELEEYDPALAALIREALGDVTVSSSCHSAATHPRSDSTILGTVLGPDGAGVGGVALWAWSGEASNSEFSTTQPDGAFAIAVPDGSFTLDIYANAGEDCTFVGWYGPDGFTTMRESATLVVIDGASVSGIEIILPQELDELPFIEWCA